MKIDEFFDKGYYINLDRRLDRKNQFIEEALEVNLLDFFERYPGVEPNFNGIPPEDSVALSYRKLGACAESHVNIIKKAVDLKLNNVIIFEDDIKFYNDGDIPGIKLIEAGLDTLSTIEDWDIVYFGAVFKNFNVEQIGNHLVKANEILTSHAWGINKSAYSRFLNYKPNNGLNLDFDGPLDSYLGNDFNLNKFVVTPLAIYQRCDTLSDCNLYEDAFIKSVNCVGPWLNNYANLIIK